MTSNIAEGFERGTNTELLNYLFIARGSAGEVRAQLYIALDLGYINKEEFDQGIQIVQNVSSLIYSFVQSLKSSTFKGFQYRTVQKKKDYDLDILVKFKDDFAREGTVVTEHGPMPCARAEEWGEKIVWDPTKGDPDPKYV